MPISLRRLIVISIATGGGVTLAAVALAVGFERHHPNAASALPLVHESAPVVAQIPIVPADALTSTEMEWAPRTGDAAN